MRYIIETNNGNPRILEQKNDGTYQVIAIGAGDKSLSAIEEMCKLANR